MPDTKAMEEMSPAELKDLLAGYRGEFAALRTAEQRDESAVASLIRQVNDADTFLSIALNSDRVEALRYLEGLSQAPSAATGALGGGGLRSIGEQIVNSQSIRSWVEGGMRSELVDGGKFLTVEANGSIDAALGFGHRFEMADDGGVRAIVGEFGSGGPGNAAGNGVNTLLPVGQPIPPVARQARLFMRDLIPVQPTTLTQVPYVQEINPTSLEGGASAVAEGNLKPDVLINLGGQTASVTVIAGNVSPTKQLWEDAPLVVAYINQRLPYLVKLKEDREILAGSGTWPDIKGITQQSGLQSQAATAGESAITIGLAIAKVELVDGTASAVVMNPTDAWAMFTKRASGGSGTFDAGTPFAAGGFSTVWGLPVMRSRAYAAGSALVGDFARGAMILDREQVNVQVYPQHSDYAARNAVLVQAEERVGLMVPRPDYFVQATIA